MPCRIVACPRSAILAHDLSSAWPRRFWCSGAWSMWCSQSHSLSASTLILGLSRRPVASAFDTRPLRSAITASPAIGCSSAQPPRRSTASRFGAQLLRRSASRFGCLLECVLVCFVCFFVVPVIAHRSSNFWRSAALVLRCFVALSTSRARSVQPSAAWRDPLLVTLALAILSA